MRVKVKLLPREKKFKDVDVKNGAIGKDLLEKLRLQPDAYIIARKGNPIPLDEELKEGEKISIFQVISGG
jgi:sulfur carrier protein ThiS